MGRRGPLELLGPVPLGAGCLLILVCCAHRDMDSFFLVRFLESCPTPISFSPAPSVKTASSAMAFGAQAVIDFRDQFASFCFWECGSIVVVKVKGWREDDVPLLVLVT